MNETYETVRSEVMDAIRKGRVKMRPRWHFVLFSALFALGVVIVLLAVLYFTSLAVFFLQQSGGWFVPSFGARGWFDFFRALPVLLILLGILFALLLEVMVRRYAFVYRKPLLVSLVAILVLVFVGGTLIAQTSFHRQMEFFASHGQLPPPLNALYGPSFRAPRPPDMYRGTIEALVPGGFILMDPDNDSTTTVHITSHTRLPYGEDFSMGEEVVVVGDPLGSSSVSAFGVREIDQ